MKVIKAQKEILIGTFVCAIIYFLMWALLYSPIAAQNIQLKNYLADINNMIDSIEATVNWEITLSQALEDLALEKARAKKAFSLTSDDGIQLLTEMALKNKLKIQSVDHPEMEEEEPLAESQTAPAKKIREEIVRLSLSGRFTDLVAYLEELRTTRDLYLGIEKLNVIKPTGSDENCDITLDLKLFLSV